MAKNKRQIQWGVIVQAFSPFSREQAMAEQKDREREREEKKRTKNVNDRSKVEKKKEKDTKNTCLIPSAFLVCISCLLNDCYKHVMSPQ